MPFPAILTDINRNLLKQYLVRHINARTWAFNHGSKGKTISSLSKAELEACCDACGIDAEAVIQQALAATSHLPVNPILPIVPATTPATEEAQTMDMIDTQDPNENETAADTLQGMAAIILKPIENFASPAILAELQKRVDAFRGHAQDLLDNAERKALSAGRAPEALAASPSRKGKVTLGKLFRLSAGAWSKLPVTCWDATERTPAIDPDYLFDPNVLGLVVSALERGENSWVHGPKGAGKSELVKNISAYTGRPLFEIGCSWDMDKYTLVGGMKPDGSGKLAWQDGVFCKAIRTAGAIIAIEEPSAARDDFRFVIQTAADRRRFTVEETGEVIPFADGVVLIALDNTDGYGDSTNQYAGTSRVNEAFLDRFPRKIGVETPPQQKLAAIITQRTGLPAQASDMLAALMKVTESMMVKNQLSTSLSLRPVLTLARDLVAGHPTMPCIEATVLSAMPATEAQALRQHIKANMNLQALEASARGTVSAMPESIQQPAPQDRAAATEFAAG
jgi:MoxR-like ATPase